MFVSVSRPEAGMAAAAAAAHACVPLRVSKAALEVAGLQQTVFHILWWQPQAAVTDSKRRGAAQGAYHEFAALVAVKGRPGVPVQACHSVQRVSLAVCGILFPVSAGRACPLPLTLAAVKNVGSFLMPHVRVCGCRISEPVTSQLCFVSAHWCLVLL